MTVPHPVRRLLRLAGVDRAIGYTLLGTGLARLAGPVQLLLIASALDEREQGVYYAFASLLGLQVFFELGLATVLAQVVSHERAVLDWDAAGRLTGDPVALGRVAGLLRLGLAWYAAAAALAAVAIFPAGWSFFATTPGIAGVAWAGPWAWLVAVSLVGSATLPLQVVPTGCGLVAEAARLQVWQGAASYAAAWTAFAAGGKLYASPAGQTAGLAVALVGVFGPGRLRACLGGLLRAPVPAGAISWWREVWPFQWRIALSWLAGYFIFQLFVPVLLWYHGPAAAGQMGMSLNVLMTASNVAMTWVNTKLPEAGRRIARREFVALDALLRPAAVRSVAFTALAAGGVTAGVAWLQAFGQWPGDRFLPALLLGVLAVTVVVNQIVFCEAAYLRAFKREPFLGLSLVAGALVGLSTYYLGRAYGADGMLGGYLAVCLVVGLGGGTAIFRRKRREWQRGDGP